MIKDIKQCNAEICEDNNILRRELNFITKANKIHGEYDYSKLVYVNYSSKVKIICKTHGPFFQSARQHISLKSGCPKCAISRNSKKRMMSKENFLTLALKKHGKRYDYIKSKYVGSKILIEIYCLKCKTYFNQTPHNHLRNGCINISCQKKKPILKRNVIISQFQQVHDEKYDYNKIDYKGYMVKVEIVCIKHGSFFQAPNLHLRGSGCPKCNESIGEKKIRNILKEYDIKFESQVVIELTKLSFDFYIPAYNTYIEFDGIQHYKPIEFFGGIQAFKQQQINDNIKNAFCKVNHITLLRIKYDDDVLEKLEIMIRKNND